MGVPLPRARPGSSQSCHTTAIQFSDSESFFRHRLESTQQMIISAESPEKETATARMPFGLENVSNTQADTVIPDLDSLWPTSDELIPFPSKRGNKNDLIVMKPAGFL